MAGGSVRQYDVRARSTDTFGRVLCSAREHHFVVDGPAQNGCPGEAITPAELFLSGVAACGVELLQVLAREQQFGDPTIQLEISGTLDRGNPVRRDVTVFNSVRIQFHMRGITEHQGHQLVEQFKGR